MEPRRRTELNINFFRRAVLVAFFGLMVALVQTVNEPASAATPRAGNQCKKRESGVTRSGLKCVQTGKRYVWERVVESGSANSCDPNYEPCVPIASDVDCAGGSGNGPAYVVGPVRVIGADIYGLDRDGDGVGCESR